jgi:uncharacterized iron-regulated membrane protein
MTFRGFLMWVHLVIGLSGAFIIAILAITGAYITFQVPLQRWLTPVPAIEPFRGAVDFERIISTVHGQFPNRRVAMVDVRSSEATVVRLGDRTAVFVDPRSATVIGSRPARFASLENLTSLMRRMHTSLVLGRRGTLIVTLATAETLLLALTGLWLWWRKKHWRLFKPWRGSWFRISWDLHNATGIWFLIPVLAMSLTGVLLAVPKPVFRMSGAAPAPFLGPPASRTDGSGAAAVTLARVLAVADSLRPGITATRVVVPDGGRGSFAVDKGRETVFVDQYSGEVLEVRPFREPTAADDALEAVERIHTGELLSIPGQTIMTLGTIMLAVMSLTGLVLGWKRLLILARTTPADD